MIRNRPGGTKLTLERPGINLWWQGYGGLRLNHLKSKLRVLSSLEDTPDVIVLHVDYVFVFIYFSLQKNYLKNNHSQKI